MGEVAAIVGYILSGRPVLRDAAEQPFYSDDDVFHLSYWMTEEIKQLKSAFDPLREDQLRELDPKWGALPIIQEALETAFTRKSGLIIIVA